MQDYVVNNKKGLKQQNVAYFRSFKVGSVYPEASFAHYYRYLKQIYEVVTWSGFLLTDLCLVTSSLVGFRAFLTLSVEEATKVDM